MPVGNFLIDYMPLASMTTKIVRLNPGHYAEKFLLYETTMYICRQLKIKLKLDLHCNRMLCCIFAWPFFIEMRLNFLDVYHYFFWKLFGTCGQSFFPVVWLKGLMYLRIPTTTKQSLLSCFKRLPLLWLIPVVIWTLNWQGQQCRNIFS